MLRTFLFLFFSLMALPSFAVIQFDRRYVRFPDLSKENSSLTEQVLVLNAGNRPINLRIDEFNCFPNFVINKSGCTSVLPARQACPLIVTAVAEQVGLRQCDLRIIDSEGYADNLKLEVLIQSRRR